MNMFKRVFIGVVFILLFITFFKAASQNDLYIVSRIDAAQGVVTQNNWKSYFGTLPKLAHAQETFYIASTFELADPDIKNNDIISRNNDGKLMRSTLNYDTTMFGVAVDTAPMVFRTSETGKPIARSGDVKVNVTTLNGPIAIGDSITSSTIPGKGQKAGNASG